MDLALVEIQLTGELLDLLVVQSGQFFGSLRSFLLEANEQLPTAGFQLPSERRVDAGREIVAEVRLQFELRLECGSGELHLCVNFVNASDNILDHGKHPVVPFESFRAELRGDGFEGLLVVDLPGEVVTDQREVREAVRGAASHRQLDRLRLADVALIGTRLFVRQQQVVLRHVLCVIENSFELHSQ